MIQQNNPKTFKKTDHPNIHYNQEGKLVKEYECSSHSIFEEKKKKYVEYQQIVEKQLKQFKNYRPCLIEILEYNNSQSNGGRESLYVTYKCDSSSKSFQQILKTQLSAEEKLVYFSGLLTLAEIHKELNIIHQNMKPSNVIWNKDKFLLTDFAYQEKPSKKDNPINFSEVDQKNYVDNISNKEHQRNLFPYLSDKFIDKIKNACGQKEQLIQIYKTIKISERQKEDRYALGIMMLELFVPFNQFYQNCEFQTFIEQSRKREDQIQKIQNGENIENFGQENINIIKQIIQNLLKKDELPKKETKILSKIEENQKLLLNSQTQREQQTINDSVTGEEDKIRLIRKSLDNKMNSQYYKYVHELLSERIFLFDENLLYYLNEEELKHYLMNIREIYPNMEKKAKDLHGKLIALKQKTTKQNNFIHFSKEEKYYLLQYYYNFMEINQNYESQIDEINKFKESEFSFNNIDKELTKKKQQQIQQYIQIEESQIQQYIQIEEENPSEVNINQIVPQKVSNDPPQSTFIDLLKQKIPDIYRFKEYGRLLQNLKQLQDIEEWDFQLWKTIEKEGKSIIFSMEQNEKKKWCIYDSKLYIGEFNENSDEHSFKGEVIQKKKKTQDLKIYQDVEINNLFQGIKKDQKVQQQKILIFKKGTYDLLSYYEGVLDNNYKKVQGRYYDIKNNYEYNGKWKDNKWEGEGEYKIIDQEFPTQKDFIKLDKGTFSQGYLVKGEQILLKHNLIPPSKPLENAIGYYYFYETLAIIKQKKRESYIFKTDFEKCLKIIGQKISKKCALICQFFKNSKKKKKNDLY